MSYRPLAPSLINAPVALQQLYQKLPGRLPPEQIFSANDGLPLGPGRYTFGDEFYDALAGTFLPTDTGEFVFRYLLAHPEIVRGRSYIAMGCGLGVDCVLAAQSGASTVFGMDIHGESVESAQLNYTRIIGTQTPAQFLVSDLFEQLPLDQPIGVVAFNPPAVDFTSDDPVAQRVCFTGPQIVHRFFEQLAQRVSANPEVTVLMVISNTTDMPAIIEGAYQYGFVATLRETQRCPAPDEEIVTHLFEFRRPGPSIASSTSSRL